MKGVSWWQFQRYSSAEFEFCMFDRMKNREKYMGARRYGISLWAQRTRKVDFINEWNKRIDTRPNKNREVRWLTQDENVRWITTKKKKKLGLIFNIQNSQLVNWYWPKKKKSFGYTAKIGLLQIFKLLVFVLSREKCHYQSHWIRNFRFFFSYFGVPPLLGKVWTSPSVSDTDFSVFYQPMDWERRTLFHSFINLIE